MISHSFNACFFLPGGDAGSALYAASALTRPFCASGNSSLCRLGVPPQRALVVWYQLGHALVTSCLPFSRCFLRSSFRAPLLRKIHAAAVKVGISDRDEGLVVLLCSGGGVEVQ